MADNKTAQGQLETVDTRNDDFDDLKASGNHEEEVRIARLTEEDFLTLSAESLTLRSKTGVLIWLYMFVHGCNQAGYGIDWVSRRRRMFIKRIKR
jgi:hypothetical protein